MHSDGGVLSNSLFGQAVDAGTMSILDASLLPGTRVTDILYICLKICLPHR